MPADSDMPEPPPSLLTEKKEDMTVLDQIFRRSPEEAPPLVDSRLFLDPPTSWNAGPRGSHSSFLDAVLAAGHATSNHPGEVVDHVFLGEEDVVLGLDRSAVPHRLYWGIGTEKGYKYIGPHKQSIHPEMEDSHWPTIDDRCQPARQRKRQTKSGEQRDLNDDVTVASTPGENVLPRIEDHAAAAEPYETCQAEKRKRKRRHLRNEAHLTCANGARVFVIADGHGGAEASRFFVVRSQQQVRELMDSREWDFSREEDREDFRAEIGRVCQMMDAEYCANKVAEYARWLDAGKPVGSRPADDGATLVINILHRGFLVNCNVGDSRTLVAAKLPTLSDGPQAFKQRRLVVKAALDAAELRRKQDAMMRMALGEDQVEMRTSPTTAPIEPGTLRGSPTEEHVPDAAPPPPSDTPTTAPNPLHPFSGRMGEFYPTPSSTPPPLPANFQFPLNASDAIASSSGTGSVSSGSNTSASSTAASSTYRPVYHSFTESGSHWTPIFTSNDHNMTHPEKVNSIHRAGGQFVNPNGTIKYVHVQPDRVTPYHELVGARIYRPANKAIRTIGVSNKRTLNLTATMGDLLFKVEPAVLCSRPDVEFIYLDPAHNYMIVVATDGVWDHISYAAVDTFPQEWIGRPSHDSSVNLSWNDFQNIVVANWLGSAVDNTEMVVECGMMSVTPPPPSLFEPPNSPDRVGAEDECELSEDDDYSIFDDDDGSSVSSDETDVEADAASSSSGLKKTQSIPAHSATFPRTDTTPLQPSAASLYSRSLPEASTSSHILLPGALLTNSNNNLAHEPPVRPSRATRRYQQHLRAHHRWWRKAMGYHLNHLATALTEREGQRTPLFELHQARYDDATACVIVLESSVGMNVVGLGKGRSEGGGDWVVMPAAMAAAAEGELERESGEEEGEGREGVKLERLSTLDLASALAAAGGLGIEEDDE
ncbi:hypothetical protein BJ742DRAFT_831680 [Cladochytrium replicatum]|nr:hypothetical protein BJ742DRAFT_831680 [Cladochytrium replicatum]